MDIPDSYDELQGVVAKALKKAKKRQASREDMHLWLVEHISVFEQDECVTTEKTQKLEALHKRHDDLFANYKASAEMYLGKMVKAVPHKARNSAIDSLRRLLTEGLREMLEWRIKHSKHG